MESERAARNYQRKIAAYAAHALHKYAVASKRLMRIQIAQQRDPQDETRQKRSRQLTPPPLPT